MSKVFRDTGYVLALELTRDQNHLSVQQHWQSIVLQPPSFVTTSYVFAEVVTFFNNRGKHAKAVQVGNRLLLSPTVQLINVDEPLFQEGWEFFQQHQDKDYSLTDCVSFIVMKELSIGTAFTLDGHFQQAGFKREP